ncbi:MAG: hypothetical protein QXE81_01360 [Desulfurococcaceae archaeon]
MLHGGVLVESVDTRLSNLRQVLGKYISERFTGYIIYRAKETQMYIGLVNGNIAICRSIKYIPVHLESVFGETRRKTIVDGAECCEDVVKYLDDTKGSIEVYKMDHNVFLINTIIAPQSRIEINVPLAKELKTGVGVPVPLVTQPPLTLKPPVEVPTKPLIEPEVELTPPVPRKEVKFDIKEMTVDECIDPFVLYKVIRSSQLEEFIETASIEEIARKIQSINDQKKPSLIYVSGTLEDQNVKILFNTQTSTINIEIEKKGATICGREAANILQEKKIRTTRIWSMK